GLSVPSGAERVIAGPGSVVFVEGPGSSGIRAGGGGVHALQLQVSEDWRPAAGSLAAEEGSTGGDGGFFKRIYKGADDRSYFRDFPELLVRDGETVSAARPIVGLWFAQIPQGYEIDWHPEIVNQLVIVLDGVIE